MSITSRVAHDAWDFIIVQAKEKHGVKGKSSRFVLRKKSGNDLVSPNTESIVPFALSWLQRPGHVITAV